MLTCKFRIDAIGSVPNAVEHQYRDPGAPDTFDEFSFTMLEGFEGRPLNMPQVRLAVGIAVGLKNRYAVEYKVEDRQGRFELPPGSHTLKVGQIIEAPITTYLHPPKTADDIVAALERDPANLVITYYCSHPHIGWIEPHDDGSNYDARPDFNETVDDDVQPELAKAIRDGRVGIDDSGQIRLARFIDSPLTGSEFEDMVQSFAKGTFGRTFIPF